MSAWYQITNENEIDSPALLVYPDRIKKNIALTAATVRELTALRPHVKTHKLQEVTNLLLEAGITKFKCATIAETEMVARAGGSDILLAYQPTQPKAQRLLELKKLYPEVSFSCLIDNDQTAQLLSDIFQGQSLQVYIDLNVGMNRTGIMPEQAPALFQFCEGLSNIEIIGLHAYDGHIHDHNLTQRTEKADAVYTQVMVVKGAIEEQSGSSLKIVMGGTPTFPIHAQKAGVETSPGTFIFWDEGYRSMMPDLAFNIAAILLMRVISIIDNNTLCLDLGHKSVASENPFPRVKFLNVEQAEAIGHSEEHLVVRVPDTTQHRVGDVWYGIPYHICPTVALHDSVQVVENNKVVTKWKVVARDRSITI